MLMCDRNQHNIVIILQLKINKLRKKTQNKKTSHGMGENIQTKQPTGELISKTYGLCSSLSIYILKKSTQSKVNRRSKYSFLQRDIQMTKKHTKRCSTSIIRDMQIKTTMKYNLTSVRMAIVKKFASN